MERIPLGRGMYEILNFIIRCQVQKIFNCLVKKKLKERPKNRTRDEYNVCTSRLDSFDLRSKFPTRRYV